MRSLHDGRGDEPVRPLLRDAQFVPETKRVAELLPDMQDAHFHMAIVIDEYGTTAGLVTLEDLLEELVGEITDEYDVEAPLVEPHPNGTAHISGRVRIDEANDLLGTDFPEGDWDTVAGLLCALLGHIPTEGETAACDDHTLRADKVRGRRVTRIHVAKRADHSPPPTCRDPTADAVTLVRPSTGGGRMGGSSEGTKDPSADRRPSRYCARGWAHAQGLSGSRATSNQWLKVPRSETRQEGSKCPKDRAATGT